jgi:murein DD-endopeptidase MepM/ murein hydrolase activator NlpD
MNSPYKGKFKVTQEFKGLAHDGLDLVGLSSKEIYSTVDGVVERAGWENADNKRQGFGLYVRIKQNDTTDRYYFGHLSEVKVKVGDTVKAGQVIGIEGSTGKSTGSHCHYCVRGDGLKTKVRDINKISGIPNKKGTYKSEESVKYYLVKKSWKNVTVYKTKHITQARKLAEKLGYVVYDENGKTIYSYR